MQNENVNLNKDFKVSQQADAAQKAQEEERSRRMQKIEDAKERSRIEKMKETRDAEVARATQIKRDEHEKFIRNEVQRRIDNQKAPSFDLTRLKSIIGNSPQDLDAKVRAEVKAQHERELGVFSAGVAVPYNDVLDKHINQAIDRQEEQQRELKAQQTFEKDTTRSPDSSRDAFQKAHDQTGGEKDWRSLKSDREAEAKSDRER